MDSFGTAPGEADPFAPLSEEEAAHTAATETAERRAPEVWEPIMPAPGEPPVALAIRHMRYGVAAVRWVYRDAEARPLFAVARFATPDGKELTPYSWGRREWTVKTGPNAGARRSVVDWHFKRVGVPVPLYGLDRLAERPDAPVLVVEGEKAADAAAELFPDMVAITSQGGSKAAGKSDWTPLAGRNVVIWPDHDVAGSLYAGDAASLANQAGATSVRTVDVPTDWPDGWDLADALPEGATPDTLAELLADAPADNRPTIELIDGLLAEIATKAEAAILKSGLPVFQRGSSLVRPVTHEVPAAKGRTTVAAGLRELNQFALVDTLAQAARWETFDARKQEMVLADPPSLVANIILNRAGRWTLPALAGIITTPTLRPDGSILTDAGYDPSTRLYLVPDPALTLPPIPERPSREQAMAALALLGDLLAEFPFVADADRSVALSAILTPVVRGALTVAPLHAIRASTAGTGKSYLGDLSSIISTGRLCPVAAAGRTEEETEKRLVGLLLAGFPVISIDNLNGELGGDLLCQAIERPLVRLRPLGRSDIVEVESRATVLATGNALRVRGDMTRRTVICTLDAGMERPELRSFAADPVQIVLADRGRYVAACLTIARACLAAGKPDRLPPIASFGDWSDLVRSALVWLGCTDPAVSMEAAREDDPELAELREVLTLWEAAFGQDEGLTTRDVAAAACARTKTTMGEPTDPEFPGLM